MIRPAKGRGYPDGFTFASSRRVALWEPDPAGPSRSSIATWVLDRFQGAAGPWLLLDTDAGSCAFRPDDWDGLQHLLDDAGMPIHKSRPSQSPPEPNGGLAAIAMLASIGAALATLLSIRNLPDMANPNNLAVGAAAILLWLVVAGSVLIAPALSRWHRRRHAKEFTGQRAQ